MNGDGLDNDTGVMPLDGFSPLVRELWEKHSLPLIGLGQVLDNVLKEREERRLAKLGLKKD